MKIIVIGAGFAGLATAYHLKNAGHDVTVFEKETTPGGLAIGYQEKGWNWSLEKHYHHFFTNDAELINLAGEIGIADKLIFPKSQTSVFENGKIYPFNNVLQVLSFSPLPLFDRMRLGFATLLCKLIPVSYGLKLERFSAYGLAKTVFGEKVFNKIWKPLLDKKFGDYKERVNASWLWARIRKRTLQLGYVKGGFQAYADSLAAKCQKMGVKIYFGKEIYQANYLNNQWQLTVSLEKKETFFADAVVSTLPTPVFTALFTTLPLNYKEQLASIPHLHALNMIIKTKKPVLDNTYWLNINDADFPFLCAVQHTNFIDQKNYGGNHLLYLGNYLPDNHEYFRKSKTGLWKIYQPYVKKISPDFTEKILMSNIKLCTGYFAQPVFEKNYSQVRPFGKTPLPNLYFVNLDSVYPWDRGTNYALLAGRKMAEMIDCESSNNK